MQHPATKHCQACTVGVATGPESHAPDCPARMVPMPAQDGQWTGPEWDDYDRHVHARVVSLRRREFGAAVRHVLDLPADVAEDDVIMQLSLWKYERSLRQVGGE